MGSGVLQRLGESARAVAITHINRIVGAVQGDFLPRGAGGIPSNGEQDLGSPSNRWGNWHIKGDILLDGKVQKTDRDRFLEGSFGRLSFGVRGILASAWVQTGAVVGEESAFLIPKGSAGVEVFASHDIPLVVRFKDGTTLRVTTPITVPLVQTRAAGKGYTMRTALPPESHRALFIGRYWGCRAMGYYGTRMPVADLGDGILEGDIPWVAFTDDETGLDCGLCRVTFDGLDYFLTDAWRGYFGSADASGNYTPGEITAFDRNVTLHVAPPNHIFLRKDGTAFAHARNLYYSVSAAMDQRTPANGDIRINHQTRRWEQYSSTTGAWATAEICYLGMAIPSSTGGCNFARGVWISDIMTAFSSSPAFSTGGAINLQDGGIRFLVNTGPTYNRRTRGRNWGATTAVSGGAVSTVISGSGTPGGGSSGEGTGAVTDSSSVFTPVSPSDVRVIGGSLFEVDTPIGTIRGSISFTPTTIEQVDAFTQEFVNNVNDNLEFNQGQLTGPPRPQHDPNTAFIPEPNVPSIGDSPVFSDPSNDPSSPQFVGPPAPSDDDEEDDDDDNGDDGGFCFITTATMRAVLNKRDAEVTLNEFRRFRDTFMAGSPDVAAYYALSPRIVHAIGGDLQEYQRIWEDWLTPAQEAIHRGKHEEARRIYTNMVSHLERRWLPPAPVQTDKIKKGV